MNVGTMTATVDPVLAIPADGASSSSGSEAGGFAAVLRDAGGRTDDATSPASPDAGPGADTGDAATNDAAEAAATELLLITWQRTTTTGLAGTAPAAERVGATPAAADVVTVAPTVTIGPALPQQEGAAVEAAVLPEAEPAPETSGVDLTGMQSVPETPHESMDLGTPTPGDDQGSQPAPQQEPSEDGVRRAALAGATSAPSAAAVTAAGPSGATPTASVSVTPIADTPAPDAPSVDPAAQAVPQAPTRVDALAAPTTTIRADELQRAIADTARQLADQGGGRHRISVHITSPDLGQVVVEIVSRGSEVRVTLQPQDAGAEGSLQQQHQAVARALANEGFNLSDFDVHTGHPDGRHREDAPQHQRVRILDDELVDLTTIDDGALRL